MVSFLISYCLISWRSCSQHDPSKSIRCQWMNAWRPSQWEASPAFCKCRWPNEWFLGEQSWPSQWEKEGDERNPKRTTPTASSESCSFLLAGSFWITNMLIFQRPWQGLPIWFCSLRHGMLMKQRRSTWWALRHCRVKLLLPKWPFTVLKAR